MRNSERNCKLNKLFKNLVPVGLALSLMLGMVSTSFAEDTNASTTTEATIKDKINDMYSNIDNETIRKMHIDSTLYFLSNDANRTICVSPKTIEAYESPAFTTTAVLERGNQMEYVDYFVYTKDQAYIDENTAGIALLYDLCQVAKNDTVNMSEEQKMGYLMAFVSSYMTYNYDYMNAELNRQITPTFFQKLLTKSGVCRDFAQLFCILGEYIGLNTSLIRGTYNGEGHAWCAVTINGVRYTIETQLGKFTWEIPANYVEIERKEDLSTCVGLW